MIILQTYIIPVSYRSGPATMGDIIGMAVSCALLWIYILYLKWQDGDFKKHKGKFTPMWSVNSGNNHNFFSAHESIMGPKGLDPTKWDSKVPGCENQPLNEEGKVPGNETVE